MNDMIEFNGNDVTIRCPESSKPSNPEPQISWKADGKPLKSDSRYTIGINSLTIRRVRKEDTHNYTCVKNNTAGMRNQTMHLQIYGE